MFGFETYQHAWAFRVSNWCFLLALLLLLPFKSNSERREQIVKIEGKLFRGECIRKKDIRSKGAVCVYGEFVNNTGEHLCIEEFYAPAYGVLKTPSFELKNANSGQKAQFLGLEPSFVFEEPRLAQLVRLMEPGASLSFVVNLSRYYDISEGIYDVKFKAPVSKVFGF